MQATYIRNKFALYGNKIALLLILLALSQTTNAQFYKWARQNNPNYDERKISYGFSIGLHTSTYQVKYSDQFVTPKLDTVHSVIPSYSPGFSLGFLVNYHVAEFLDLRLMPKAGFYAHRLDYYYTNAPTKSQLIETTLVEFPLLLKYKSMRRGNVRMYMIGGFTPGFEISGKSDAQSAEDALSIQKRNLSIDAGMGFDFYFPLFKYSQEIRFSRGITNMLAPGSSVYNVPIRRLNTNTISIYFIFQ